MGRFINHIFVLIVLSVQGKNNALIRGLCVGQQGSVGSSSTLLYLLLLLHTPDGCQQRVLRPHSRSSLRKISGIALPGLPSEAKTAPD